MDINSDRTAGGGPAPGWKARIATSTPEATRRTLGRMLKLYLAMPTDGRDHQTFRNVIYCCSILLSDARKAEELNIGARLEEMESIMAKYEGGSHA